MTVLVPATVDEAVVALFEHPNSELLAGGTDFMVEVNAGGRRPDSVVALDRVAELREWSVAGNRLRLGAAVTRWSRDRLSAHLRLQYLPI